jgi:hypothetical protein
MFDSSEEDCEDGVNVNVDNRKGMRKMLNFIVW